MKLLICILQACTLLFSTDRADKKKEEKDSGTQLNKFLSTAGPL